MADPQAAELSAEPVADQPCANASPFAQLTRERQALGLSLDDAAHQLKLATRQIVALEAGDVARLPGGAFARGMLRNYARLLKLDAAPLLAALGERSSGMAVPERAVVLPEPVPFADGARRVNLPYLLVSAGVLVVVAGLALGWLRDGGGRAPLEFVSAAQIPSASQPVSASAPQPATPGVAPAPAIEVAQAETAPAPSPPVATARGQGRINLSFERESWVEITDRAGRRLISQLNPAGSARSIEGMPPFDVVIGNAQHVTLTYEDRPIDLMPHVKVEVARFTLE